MKIIIAPDSFKESLTALQVAKAIEIGFRYIFPDGEYIKVPMADGGEGTVQSMVDATQGHFVDLEVTGPLGNKVMAQYGILGAKEGELATSAVIEMASASGLHLVPREQRNPLYTTSFGTGELIKDALDRGIKHIVLGLGGSATNDAGAGLAQALGIQFKDDKGQELAFGGEALAQLKNIDTSQIHPLLSLCQIDVACDVDNPLCGERGASAIFGPQKGATPEIVTSLDNTLAYFADVIAQSGFEDHRLEPGAGAAGGMGLGVKTFLNATLKPGIEIVMETVGFADILEGADLVITGEGRIDGQTVFGKTPMGVLKQANMKGVATIGIAGSLGKEADAILAHGMLAIFPIIPALDSLDNVLAQAENNLISSSRNIASMLMLGQNLS
ncbi:glycerate kinase [Marinomonas ushuaiensis DSM 15871]|uniref:Glycerate kinase n=1 Tax=Marinomonas ushuaiensis DSM 15871 TaxID=1122207 RepID=X7E7V6_9GAMM|nr:glycerate kinase [Marinomonas ushuaiensis]ETX12164.1 glycerate kinase [Marinomonas ushuaiensis DSM 15871]